ncbi:MAG: hypothetical protein J3Q66DRAFT_340945 [Benniella sp.]|nr:MAG: hypothetical protein J3Q66DRAFT_340945 [Benniella sp.]
MMCSLRRLNSPTSTCFAQTLVMDAIAIGLLDGAVVIHHIRTDTTLLTPRQKGKATSITFRTSGASTQMECYYFLIASCCKRWIHAFPITTLCVVGKHKEHAWRYHIGSG